MIKVYGHPRSGNNYLAALIKRNVYPNKNLQGKDGYVGHWADRAYVRGTKYAKLFGGHGLPHRYRNVKGEKVYIFRDGRDVALSLWNSEHFVNPEWTKTKSFSDFIRTPLDWVSSPGDKANPCLTIFEHWKRHLEMWKNSGAFLVCYEELCENPEPIILDIARLAKVKLQTFSDLSGTVGWFGSKHRGWRDIMSDEDVEYFLKKVGDCYGVYD